MKRTTRRLLMSLLVLTMSVGLLSACGSKDTASDAQSGKQEEIVIWNAGFMSFDDTGKVAQDDLPLFKKIKEFEDKNPGYKVTVVDYGMDQLTQAFTAANLAKEGPDLVAMWAGSTTMGFKDYLVDFNPYLTTDAEKAEFDTSDITHVGFDKSGANIGLPADTSTLQIYYNKQLLADAGYPDFNPATWDEFLEAAQAVKAKGKNPLVVGDSSGAMSTWVMGEFLGDLWGAEGLKGLATGKTKLDSPEFKQSMEAWMKVYDLGLVNKDFVSMDDGTAIRNFVQGDSAMIIHGSWAVREFQPMGDNVGIVKIPAITADAPFKNTIVSQPVTNVSVTSYSKHKDKAVELAKMLASNEYKEEVNKIQYTDENTLNLINQCYAWAQEGNNIIGFDSIIKSDAANEFYKMASSVTSKRSTVDELAKRMDELNK